MTSAWSVSAWGAVLGEPEGRSNDRAKLENTASEWNAENERQGRWEVVRNRDPNAQWAWMLNPCQESHDA
jgi:hypothetical protein